MADALSKVDVSFSFLKDYFTERFTYDFKNHPEIRLDTPTQNQVMDAYISWVKNQIPACTAFIGDDSELLPNTVVKLNKSSVDQVLSPTNIKNEIVDGVQSAPVFRECTSYSATKPLNLGDASYYSITKNQKLLAKSYMLTG